ncbi:MAG: hypothetical protein JO363_07175 [Solirubrobacterales bacterium]|nr:hypothetical protein [Solirubrobacterales bacterium]
MTIDMWVQHPTLRFLAQDMFESLRRWTGHQVLDQEIPISATLGAMDQAGISFGLLSAWHAPREGGLIANDEVSGWVHEYPDRFTGLEAVDLDRPNAGRPRAAPLLRRAGVQSSAGGALAVGRPTYGPALLEVCATASRGSGSLGFSGGVLVLAVAYAICDASCWANPIVGYVADSRDP